MQRPGEHGCRGSHPGSGPITAALATEVFLGDPARFADSKALASYVGMIPREYSSGGRQRFGGLSKQGNPLLRFLWGEAGAHAASGKELELQRFLPARELIQVGSSGQRGGGMQVAGIRLWTALRDQIACHGVLVYRRQKQQKSGDASCVGMPETPLWCEKVTGRLIRLPASLKARGVRITHHGRW